MRITYFVVLAENKLLPMFIILYSLFRCARPRYVCACWCTVGALMKQQRTTIHRSWQLDNEWMDDVCSMDYCQNKLSLNQSNHLHTLHVLSFEAVMIASPAKRVLSQKINFEAKHDENLFSFQITGIIECTREHIGCVSGQYLWT